MMCARCLEPLNLSVRYRRCPDCHKSYHRGKCYALHRKHTHTADGRKYFGGRRFFERSNKANRLWRKKGDDDGVCKSVTSAGGSDEPAGAKENVGGQKF